MEMITGLCGIKQHGEDFKLMDQCTLGGKFHMSVMIVQ